MWRPGWIRSVRPPKAERQAPPGSRRYRLAVLLALVTVVCLGSAFFLSKGTQFLMPGPLASAHGAIENCSACHTKSGSGKLSWIHGLVAGDPLADSKACLTCHRMPDTAFNAHSASAEVLKQSTERLTKIAAETPAPQSARAQSIAFPTHDVVARGLYCATCHQEHQGVNFNLNKLSNEQCRSCHVVKFDSFDGHHPKFENYPFKQRTRIIYDHAGHFGKHYPEVAKKDPARRIPATCSTCHNSREDKRVMAVAPFEQTCTACHLDQIIGKERVSGPKGIAFLTLPGLDLQTLKKKNASIGEWPDASEAALTPFMKVMISRNERGRALIKTVDSLNLQDLTDASDDQIKVVTNLIWEIKGLFYALIKGKASDVLADLNIASGAKLSAALVSDLTASIPRDVVISAQQQWLPNLAAEMANRPSTSKQKQSGLGEVITQSSMTVSASTEDLSRSNARKAAPRLSPRAVDSEVHTKEAAEKNDTPRAKPDNGMQTLAADDSGGATIGERLPLPSGTPRAIEALSKDAEKAARPKGAAGETDAANAKPDGGKETPSANEQPRAKPRIEDAETAAQPEGALGKADAANAADGGKETRSPDEPPQDKATEQTDDLLFPTEDELRAIKAGIKDTGKTAPPEGAAGKTDTANAKPDGAVSADAASKADANAPADAPAERDAAAAEPQKRAAPVISIESDVDPESWAEYGGWYRQDYVIFYRPTGHKDKFIYSWLFLTGPQAPKGGTSPAAAVFDSLTSKDAQGSCTKCHSVDDIQGKGRVVNFSPPSVESKQGRFTSFIHEPHFGILENRGCLTCHNLEKGRPYLKSYEQGNRQNFVSNFGAVKKDLCQTCHTSSMARQDCLLCHKYHVNGVITPIMNTRIPTQ
ncbi:MAG TPA: cytochrome c3 family protein [Methyloceanibacter sp.]|nr:cytochrome c3 family protein [Methyloceanibacter sp.]